MAREPQEPIICKGQDELYVVRLWDGMDGVWVDITDKPLSYVEARKIWNGKTENGTKQTCFEDIDYYEIFPSDTDMIYSGDFTMFPNR
jgi:hypothetical protein